MRPSSPRFVDRRPPKRGPAPTFLAAFLLLISSLLTLAAMPLRAGTIDVVVRAPHGQPWRGLAILLHPPGDGAARPVDRLGRPRVYQGVTDRGGLARFLDLPPGTYTVTPLDLPSTIVPPADHPLDPAPEVTLLDENDHLGVEVRLHDGEPVSVRLEAPVGCRGFLATFRHPETGFERHVPFAQEAPAITRLLPPGDWEIEVAPPPGQLLTSLEADGKSFDGRIAAVEVERGEVPIWATFTYEAGATLEGEVVALDGPPERVTVFAFLVEPGPWLDDAVRRGGSRYEELRLPVGPDGRFSTRLPEGTWRVVPAAEGLLAAEPEAFDLEIGFGEIARADFEVELEPVPEETLLVRVRNHLGERIEGAAVELRLFVEPEVLLRSGTTEPEGARLPVVPEGDYILVAGHPEYLEARRELFTFRPADVRQVDITLEPGAALRLQAFDLEKHPARGVVWTVERLGAPLALLLANAEFRTAKNEREVTTDDVGRARLTGFYPGAYRVEAALPNRGRRLGGLFHVGLPRERLERRLRVDLEADEERLLLARQRPAAHLLLRLVCDDALPVPETATAFAVDLDAPVTSAEEALDDAELVREDASLEGRRGDVLRLGPLPQGVFRMAVRPTGFDRFTWAFGEATPAEASSVPIDIDEDHGDELLDLGELELACAPAVDLVPKPPADVPGPAVDDVAVTVRLLDRNEDVVLAVPDVLHLADRYALRALPPGTVRLDAVLHHPHFLPLPDLHWQLALDLRRGGHTSVVLPIEAIGGAIEIRGEGELVRLVDAEGTVRQEMMGEDGVLVPSVRPGVYDVDLCADTTCTPPRTRFEGVTVTAGETLQLETADD